jgi:hypothetical protein
MVKVHASDLGHHQTRTLCRETNNRSCEIHHYCHIDFHIASNNGKALILIDNCSQKFSMVLNGSQSFSVFEFSNVNAAGAVSQGLPG